MHTAIDPSRQQTSRKRLTARPVNRNLALLIAGTGMKGHYLPQFYLKGFTDPETPPGHEPYLWVRKAGSDPTSWKRRGPRKVAVQANYYETNEAEATLSRLEGLTAPVLQKVRQRLPINEEECGYLATFVALMMTRVPALHDSLQGFFSELASKGFWMMCQAFAEDPRRLDAFKQQYHRETGKSDLDNVTVEQLVDPRRYTVTATRPAAIGAAFSVLSFAAGLIFRMGWRIFYSKAPVYFITSDHPFFMVDPNIPPSTYGITGTGGLVSPDIEVTLPFGREVALFASWKQDHVGYGDAPSDVVERINIRTTLAAKRLLIAAKPHFLGSERLSKAQRSPRSTS
jgi:hypothetical protein